MSSTRKSLIGCLAVTLCGFTAMAQIKTTNTPSLTNAPSLFRSPEDGWLDVSGFLDEKYGFLPVVIPITEPAVGYGAAGGLAFISKPLGDAQKGLGRPNITFLGGMGTKNTAVYIQVGSAWARP